MLYRWGWLAADPAKRIQAPKVPRMEPKAPTPVQVAALVTAAFAKGADWGTVWLLLVTGARRAEIARCQMKHVGFERSRIFIDPTKVRGTSWWLALDSATMEPLEASSRDRIADRLGTLGQTPTGRSTCTPTSPTMHCTVRSGTSASV
nr:hypothetical protein GCM10025732_30020 [Glycomyces mayteni]